MNLLVNCLSEREREKCEFIEEKILWCVCEKGKVVWCAVEVNVIVKCEFIEFAVILRLQKWFLFIIGLLRCLRGF